jgi:hypothetical protein
VGRAESCFWDLLLFCSANQFGTPGGVVIAESVGLLFDLNELNIRFEMLFIHQCKFKFTFSTIQTNLIIETLFVWINSSNNLHEQGATCLAKSLRVLENLSFLNISWVSCPIPLFCGVHENGIIIQLIFS